MRDKINLASASEWLSQSASLKTAQWSSIQGAL
jgi:hypothetical protein